MLTIAQTVALAALEGAYPVLPFTVKPVTDHDGSILAGVQCEAGEWIIFPDGEVCPIG